MVFPISGFHVKLSVHCVLLQAYFCLVLFCTFESVFLAYLWSNLNILLTQRHYVLNMLYKFGMTDCRLVSTPLDRNLKLRPDLGAAYNEKRFWQIVGSLIYLTITRPDLSYPMGVIIQFMQEASSQVNHNLHTEASSRNPKFLVKAISLKNHNLLFLLIYYSNHLHKIKLL